MNNKVLSIIIPLFNSEEGIMSTLNSLIKQEDLDFLRKKIEIIVVDNNSNDNSFDVASNFTLKYDFVKVIRQTLIQSSYASRNFGVENSTGEYLFFIDSDMILSRHCLKSIFKEIKLEKIDYAGFNVKMKLISISLSSKMNYLRGFKVKESIKNHHYTPTCALLVSRDVFNDVGGFIQHLESGGDFVFGVSVNEKNRKQVYFEHIELFHPTRTTYKSLILKSKRVVRGNVQLAIMNYSKYEYLYKRHFKLSNFMPRNPFSYKKAFEKHNISFSFKDLILSPFFHIPIALINLNHALSFFKKQKDAAC